MSRQKFQFQFQFRSFRLCGLLLSITAAVFATAVFQPAQAQGNPAGFGAPAAVPGEVIIQFRANTSAAAEQQARGRAGAKNVATIRGAGKGKGRLELASLPPGQAVAAAVRSLNAHPAIAFAEPNWIYTHAATSNDSYYSGGSLWGMYGDGTTPANQFGSQAGEAWNAGHTGNKAFAIGVIDEGIDYSHPDLQANVGNPGEVLDGKDNDGNGKIDDVNGWDFVSNDNSVYDGRGGDKHGTHVAGTIGGVGGNGTGVAGVNWNVTIISGKFLSKSGGTTANAIKAVDYFTDLKVNRGVNLVATNNSWGGGGYSQALHDAIIRGANAGILFIAAAGNDGTNNDSTVRYPAAYDTTQGTSTQSAAGFDAVISVAALSSDGSKPYWSNYGKNSVDLAAPGDGINSTLPGGSYGSYSGTSMATPHVSGAAALLAAQGISGGQAIRNAIIQGAQGTPTPSMTNMTVTGGRLNLGGAAVAVTYGSLSGSVIDNASGDAINGATVSVGGTSLLATTNENGEYSISQVPSGTYDVTATASGYQSQTNSSVAVATSAVTSNFALEAQVVTTTPMYVSGMNWSTSSKGRNTDILITVTINQDSSGDGLAGPGDEALANASVTLQLSRDESSVGTATGTTNSQGQLTFKLSKAQAGTYTATVTSVTHADHDWQTSMDLNNPSQFVF